MTVPRGPSEDELRTEAWNILFDIWSEVEHETEGGRLADNLAAFAEGRVGFLGKAMRHEIPNSVLVEVAREMAAMHARVLEALRDRERELLPDTP